jgi:SOS-response transcriptional repressor LexA
MQVSPAVREFPQFTYGTTRKQNELVAFITDYYLKTGGGSPSYDEMMRALGLRSKSGIHRLLHGLAERGKVRLIPNRARAVAPVLDELLQVRLPVELDLLVRELAAQNDESLEAAIIRVLRERFFPKTKTVGV